MEYDQLQLEHRATQENFYQRPTPVQMLTS